MSRLRLFAYRQTALDEGRQVETGTYASLVTMGGINASLAALQFCGGKKGG